MQCSSRQTVKNIFSYSEGYSFNIQMISIWAPNVLSMRPHTRRTIVQKTLTNKLVPKPALSIRNKIMVLLGWRMKWTLEMRIRKEKEGLERWFSNKEHFLLFQGTQAQYLEPAPGSSQLSLTPAPGDPKPLASKSTSSHKHIPAPHSLSLSKN